MSIHFTSLHCEVNHSDQYEQSLSNMTIRTVVKTLEGRVEPVSHFICATTCPDTLAPTLGQTVSSHFPDLLSRVPVFDLVQGCAGSISALSLATDLAECNRSAVLVTLADAAKQSVSPGNPLRANLSNGSFACLVEYVPGPKSLLHYQTIQFGSLSRIVEVELGHQTHRRLRDDFRLVQQNPLLSLGLRMNNAMGVDMLLNAVSFYDEFLAASPAEPEMMIFHQANPRIIRKLASTFGHRVNEFIDLSSEVGNCGAASVGAALYHVQDRVEGKKVFLCSFGTGGVISAGLWQL